MDLRAEIFEQPSVLRRLLDEQRRPAQAIAEALRGREVDYVFLAARGTSENAGVYAQYLFGALNGLPMALAAPSLFTRYQQPPRLKRAFVMGISQSGQSPDIVSVLEEGRRQGAPTLAITNDTSSPLAQASEFVLDISAGVEKAVAATKTYTGQLMTIAMLNASMSDDTEARMQELETLPATIDEILAREDELIDIARDYAGMTQCAVLGRGYNFATALEWALKLKELTYVVTAPYSTAEFQHGPIALVSGGFPVLAVATADAVLPDTLQVLRRLTEQHRADLCVISDDEQALALARRAFKLPQDIPPWLAPIVSIVPAQLFCYHLTKHKGYDPGAPRGLNKVTRTS